MSSDFILRIACQFYLKSLRSLLPVNSSIITNRFESTLLKELRDNITKDRGFQFLLCRLLISKRYVHLWLNRSNNITPIQISRYLLFDYPASFNPIGYYLAKVTYAHDVL
ncbi:hypothetical protein CDAR_57371 [Caerostris darwini]|uniref:Maturase K n=1 Tax=Caerostris darwini TaxID=1538125 RepID=A0AAV4TPF1_9ARAC|nr:hypothetical protein CDAR_57371 [Caerostris darwini]